MSRYSPEPTADGSWTLRNLELDQGCHSSFGAWTEARERYVNLCGVRERSGAGGVLRVLDLGTGPGWNLAALLEATAAGKAEVEVLSLEIDPEVIDLGAVCVERDESGGGEWLQVAREAVLESHARSGKRVEWGECGPRGGLRFLLGDARTFLARETGSFDAVFFDAFSPGSDPDLWSHQFLGEVASRMAEGAMLSTYTTSLRVRASLAAHGLCVGPGPRVGDKHQGTLAGRGANLDPLDARTQRKLERRVQRWVQGQA